MHKAIEIYTSADGNVQLNITLERDTLWLSQSQISQLFDTTIDNVSLHLKNIYSEGELIEFPTTEDFSVVRQEGQRQVKRTLKHYNLDAIISVGYRVSSHRATQFRIWATNRLKQHIVQGYTLNQSRLQERGIAFELLAQTLSNHQLVNPEGEAVIAVINDYARSWSMLQGYDAQSLTESTVQQAQMNALVLDDVLAAIVALKRDFIAKGEATELFGQLRGEGLASAIATIQQGFGDTLFYPNVASRAAHLLYFIIKNHPLADGNKRCGSFVFLWYLHINQHLLAKPVEHLINDNTVVALALLVADSQPEQKALMIRLIEHFVQLNNAPVLPTTN